MDRERLSTSRIDRKTKGLTSKIKYDGGFVASIITAVVAGLIAFLSNVYATYVTGSNQLLLEEKRSQKEAELEQLKFQTTLILEAIKTGNQDKAIDNLRFFISAGFIADKDGKIENLVRSRGAPVLPASQVPEIVRRYNDLQSSLKQLGNVSGAAVLSLVEKARNSLVNGDPEAAKKQLDEVTVIQDQDLKSQQLGLAETLLEKAELQNTTSNREEKISLYSRVLKLREAVLGASHPDVASVRGIIDKLNKGD